MRDSVPYLLMAMLSVATVPHPHADNIPARFRAQNDATYLPSMYGMYVYMYVCV